LNSVFKKVIILSKRKIVLKDVFQIEDNKLLNKKNILSMYRGFNSRRLHQFILDSPDFSGLQFQKTSFILALIGICWR